MTWLRWLFWVLAVLFVGCITGAYIAFPHSLAWLFLIAGFWFVFMAGDTGGKLTAAKEMEELG